MSEGLTHQSAVSHAVLWEHMQKLVDRLFGVLDNDTALDDALDILVELLGADRGLILIGRGGGASLVVNGRSRGKALTPEDREEISKTIVQQVKDTNQVVVFDSNAMTSLSESVAFLSIHAALASPLRGGAGEPQGVLYVDLRDRRKHLEASHVEFFMSAATLMGAVLEQHARAASTAEQLRGAKSFVVESRRAPILDELLAPASMRPIAEDVRTSLHGDSPILVLGESGTGKTLLAHAIAEASGRRPVVRAVLGSSDDLNTITSELFGHERGSFSGAATKRVGLVEFATGGTLILDELLNLHPLAQRLLLDFTQFGTYRPLGYDRPEPKRAHVRIIGVTNGDLRAAMADGRFREDLYHRLAGVVLEVPPLRERREDIPALAEAALRHADGARPWMLSVPMRRMLLSASMEWPGNVRQLETLMRRARERALLSSPDSRTIDVEHVDRRDLERAVASSPDPKRSEPENDWAAIQADRQRLDEREEAAIRAALTRAGGVVAQAARDLGLARTTLLSRMDSLGIRASKG